MCEFSLAEKQRLIQRLASPENLSSKLDFIKFFSVLLRKHLRPLSLCLRSRNELCFQAFLLLLLLNPIASAEQVPGDRTSIGLLCQFVQGTNLQNCRIYMLWDLWNFLRSQPGVCDSPKQCRLESRSECPV